MFFICGGEDESVDSTDSRLKKFLVDGVLSLAGKIWSVKLPKFNWGSVETRVMWLNARPVPGIFLNVADDIDDTIVLKSINAEWEVLVKNLKHCIVCSSKSVDS